MPPLPPLQKTGPDKGSLAWWNHLGWALVEIPQVSTKPKMSSYNDAVGMVGRGKIRVAEDLFLLRGVFVCCGMGLPSHFFFRNCLWEKLGQMFLLQKKKLGPRCVAEIICKTSVQVKASSGGIYKCIHGPRVTWSKGLSVVYGAGAKWDLKVDEMWHTRIKMERLWKQVRKSCTYIYIDCKYIYILYIYIYRYIHSIHMCMSLSVLLSCEITFENAFFRVCMETLF